MNDACPSKKMRRGNQVNPVFSMSHYNLAELRQRPSLLTHEVQFLLGNCSRTTIIRYRRRGLLSEPKKINSRRVLYDTDEVFALAQQKATEEV